RHVSNDHPFDAVEIGPALSPVVLILGDPDHFVRLEFDKLKRAGPDRVAAYIAWTDMAGIDRRPSGGQQCKQGRLRPLQAKRDLEITVWSHLLDIGVPGLARIDAQLLISLTGEEIPGAFDVLRRKGLAVMPFDALTQGEHQLGPFLFRGPAGGELRDDRTHAVLQHVL